MPERIYISELDSAENQEQHQVIGRKKRRWRQEYRKPTIVWL